LIIRRHFPISLPAAPGVTPSCRVTVDLCSVLETSGFSLTIFNFSDHEDHRFGHLSTDYRGLMTIKVRESRLISVRIVLTLTTD